MNKAKDICSKKQIFCILFVLAIIINCGIILTLRDMHNQDENKIEILILADRGIRISAPRDVLITYLEAYSRGEDPAILEKY